MAEIRINTTGGLKLYDADNSHYAQIVAGTITSNVDAITLGHDTVTIADNLSLGSDSAILKLGADGDATLTHDGTTGLTIAATPISIDSTGELHLNSTTGDIKLQDGGTDQIAFDLDGTAGEVIMKPAVDSDDLVISQYDGTEVIRIEDNASLGLVGNKLSIANSSSDVVIKPLTDAKDIIFQQYDGTVVATVEDNATFNIPASKLAIGGTAVTATAAELNLLDGGTSVGSSITLADADGFVVNDGGTMKTIPASDISTYAGGLTKLIQQGSFPDSGDTINFSNVFNNSSHSTGTTADYQVYILYFTDVYANGENKITVQIETGGNTYLTGSDYQRVNHGRDAAGNDANSEASSQTYVNIQSTNANQSNWASRSGHIIFPQPGQSSARKTFYGQISYFSTDSNSPFTIEQFAGMHSNGSAAMTGFRLVASTSTFEGGNYYLYGIKGTNVI